jgi:ubiquinone/menaquinone biosynthesis C-methylase UbiE
MPDTPNTTAFAGSVPANYDQYLGPVLFEPYALDIASRIDKSSYHKVLELACGTGRVTKHLAGLLAPGEQVVATDLNPDMIAVGKDMVKDEKIRWMTADALELPFEDNSFDHIICQFGVMFFPDKLKAFKEACRVLQDNGRFLFNVWDSLDVNPRSAIIKQVMDDIMGDEAPDFMSKGPYSFYDKDLIRELLKEAGFKNITLDVVQKTAYYASADDLIKGFVDGSPLNAYLVQQSPSLQQTIKEGLRTAIEKELGTSQIVSPMQAIVCSANK